MTGLLDRDPGRLRVALSIVLIAAGAALVSWSGFVFARGVPGECGGDAPPCPPGTGAAFFALMASVLVLLPIGIALTARRRPETAAAGVALTAADAAAGVFSSRFVADPMTDATTVTLWVTGVLAAVALVALAVAVLLLPWRSRR